MSWIQVNAGLTNPFIKSLIISGNNIFAGTEGSGVWKRPLSEILGVNETENKIGVTISPNPATEKVILTGARMEQIEIFDQKGRRIRTVKSNAELVVFDVSSLSPGIYFLNITTEKGFGIQKLVKQHYN